MSSILTDVKHKIGPSGDYEYFDIDIVDAINEAFAVLTQIGAGPDDGFQITSDEEEWDSYTTDIVLQSLVRKYVYKKVQITFDPPNNSSHLDAIKQQIAELEWRISVHVDPKEES